MQETKQEYIKQAIVAGKCLNSIEQFLDRAGAERMLSTQYVNNEKVEYMAIQEVRESLRRYYEMLCDKHM